MKPFFSALLAAVTATGKSRSPMQMEILVLRHQLAVEAHVQICVLALLLERVRCENSAEPAAQ